jgi:hypothetical protein
MNAGFPTLSLMATVVANVPVTAPAQISLDYQQSFSQVFPVLEIALLMGSFTESAMDPPPIGNSIDVTAHATSAQFLVSAFDSNGLTFTNFSNVSFVPANPDFDVFVTFTFSPGSKAGDSINIPITITTVAPEPGSLVLLGFGLPGLLGLAWKRRKRALA